MRNLYKLETESINRIYTNAADLVEDANNAEWYVIRMKHPFRGWKEPFRIAEKLGDKAVINDTLNLPKVFQKLR